MGSEMLFLGETSSLFVSRHNVCLKYQKKPEIQVLNKLIPVAYQERSIYKHLCEEASCSRAVYTDYQILL